ncbi:hypothetical protein BCR42DRAFT_454633 [Absidia repens]|uniref:Zn(2)-C6 fungal-type domain-containing protein n=1 Tax=Absidia repens TaxID=90262 RepID=A0A1X2I5Z7_9FUNG|nr:hypothetical protein BCR42DRAFT_454633 [Absidia repens]
MCQSPVLGQSLTTPAKSTINPIIIDHPSSTTSSSSAIDHGLLLSSMPICVKRNRKYHVASACVNCKNAHLACDVSRPCKRCILLDKAATCVDIKHKKRGRPKLPSKMPKTNDATAAMISKDFRATHGTIQTPNVDSITTATTTSNDRVATFHPRPISDIPPTPSQISLRQQSIEAFQKLHQNNTTTFTTTKDSILSTTLDQHNDTKNTELSHSSSSSATKVTFVLSMELCCTRVSNDITMTWGYYPQELTHRSMYDFIAVQSKDRLSQLHRRLLDNVVEETTRQDPAQRHQIPPSTERTTSDLYHQKTIDELSIMANGSRFFADCLHVKTRFGPIELYDISFYLGGGLGADLEDVSTLAKLYIIMICQQKKISKTEQDQQQQNQSPFDKQQPHAFSRRQPLGLPYKAILPLLAPTPTVAPTSTSASSSASISASASTSVSAKALISTTAPVLRPASTSATTKPRQMSTTQPLNRYAVCRNRPIQPKPHDLRQVSLPAHFANCISYGNNHTPTRINIAPSSSATPSSIPYAYFRPIALSSGTISVSQPSSSSPMAVNPEATTLKSPTMKNEQKALTTTDYHLVSAFSGPRNRASINHPAIQYFSQIASSKAAQDHSGAPSVRYSSSSNAASSPSELTTTRKQGMSIRSLLC